MLRPHTTGKINPAHLSPPQILIKSLISFYPFQLYTIQLKSSVLQCLNAFFLRFQYLPVEHVHDGPRQERLNGVSQHVYGSSIFGVHETTTANHHLAAALIPCYWIMGGHQAADTDALTANARIDLISYAVNVLPTIVAGIEGAGGLRPCTPGIGPGPMHSPANSGPGYS